MAEHRKIESLLTPLERVASVAVQGLVEARSARTAPSGAVSIDNADGTRTVIGNVDNGEDNPSFTLATHVGDTTPPGVPTGVTAASRSGVVVVEWDGTLDGGIPEDFYCVRFYLDGSFLGELTGAGSVTSAMLEPGSTHSVTATSEDDACLPDGTPAHNVSDATAAISVTVDDDVAAMAEAMEEELEQVREVADAAKAEADAHEAIIPVIQKDIADFKDEVEADYYTKTDVDDKTGAITSEMRASYRDSIARNLGPFYAHDFQDVYNTTTNPDGYWVSGSLSYATQLGDGWAHVSLANASGTGTMYSNIFVRAAESVPATATLLVEVRNLVTNVTSTTTDPRVWINTNLSNSQLRGTTLYFKEDGTYLVPLTGDATRSTVYLTRWWFAVSKGGNAEFDARISIYEGEYDGPFKPYVTQQDELDRTYVETAKYTVDQTGVTARLDANYTAIETVSGDLEDYKDSNDAAVAALQSQVDGQIEAWYYSVEPTTSNPPAKDWTTEELRERHRGDIYYDVTTGHSWRWMLDGSTWQWQAIPDSDAAAALAEAQKALGTANEKRRIFTSTPVAPYDVNDLWLRSYTETIDVGGTPETSTGPELWYATQLRTGDGTASGSYHESDWKRWIRRTVDYSQYANYEFKTDHALSQLGDSLETTQGDVTAVTERVSTVEQDAASWKAEVKRTYATKSATQPNLSPFFSHPLTDVYNATTNPNGYFRSDPTKSSELGVVGTQLADGWMHVEMDNSARTGNAFLSLYQSPFANLKPATAYTLLVELRNMDTDAAVGSNLIIMSQADTATLVSQTVNPNTYDDIYLAAGGTFRKALVTKPDLSDCTVFCRQTLRIAAGKRASFDIRLSLYETVGPELLLDTNAPTLEKVEAQWNRFVSDAGITDVVPTYGALSDAPTENGLTLACDGTKTGNRRRALAFYFTSNGVGRFYEAGRQYQATWWARCVSGTAYTLARFVDATGTALTIRSQPTSLTALALTSEWRRYTASIRPEVDGTWSRVYFDGSFPASTAGKVEMCGFSLVEMDAEYRPYVTGQDDLSKTYATQAQLSVTDETIRADVSKTYATKTVGNPNLSPFFAHDFDDTYNATDNPGGYWSDLNRSRYVEQLTDGWVRASYNNATTATQWANFYPRRREWVVPGGTYTFLLEWRNKTAPDGKIGCTPSSAATAQLVRTDEAAGVTLSGESGEKRWVFHAQNDALAAARTVLLRVYTYAAAGTADNPTSGTVELRASLYEGDYSGPFKPYVTDQREMSDTYATNASLEVTAEGIESRVEEKYQTKADMEGYSTTAQMNTAIDQKADSITSSVAATYQTKAAMGDYSTTAQMNSAIEQSATGITSKVAQTYSTKEELDAATTSLDLLGANLLNDVVEPYIVTSRGRHGWIVSSGGNGTGSIEDVSDSPQAGVTKSFRITGNTSGNRDFDQYVPVVAGEEYTFSAWARSLSGTVTARLRFWANEGQRALKDVSVGTAWQRVVVTLTPSSAGTNFRMLMGIAGAGGIEYVAPVLVQGYSAEQVLAMSDEAIAAISIGGRNLITLEETYFGYVHANTGALIAPGTSQERSSGFVPVSPGDRLILQAWADVTSSQQMWACLALYDSAKTYVTDPARPSKTGTAGDGYILFEYTVPSGVAYVRAGWRSFGNGYAKLERGTKPTDYTAAPEDLAARPNLIPYGSQSLSDVRDATTNPTGYWTYTPSNRFTRLSDGWVRFSRDNTSGTGNADDTTLHPIPAPGIKAGDRVTLLIETRNVTYTGNPYVYVQQVNGCQLWGGAPQTANLMNSSTIEFRSGEVAKRMVYVVDSEHVTGDHTEAFRLNFRLPAGAKVDVEFRASLYRGGYGGDYVAYSTPAADLFDTYARSVTVEQTTTDLSTRINAVKATADGEVTARTTLIRQYENGVLAAKTGESVGALVNASGSFDVVPVTWNGNEPIVGGSLASFSESLVSLLSGAGRMYVDTATNNAFTVEGGNAALLATNGSVYLRADDRNDAEVARLELVDDRINAFLVRGKGEAYKESRLKYSLDYGLSVDGLTISPVTLYDNATGTTGTVTLSESAADFERLAILFKDAGFGCGSVEVWSPNGQNVTLSGTYLAGTAIIQHRWKVMKISGTSITRVSSGFINTTVSTGAITANSTENNILVYKVIGYPKDPYA